MGEERSERPGGLRDVLQEVGDGAAALATGLKTTFKHLFRKPTTFQYPEEIKPVSERFRGRHILRRYQEGPYQGLERCIGCSLCAAACPAEAIFVEAAENTETDRRSPGERYAQVYEINMLRCIFCGYCEDACPTGAIVLGKEYELADDDRMDFVYTKDRLLESRPD